MTYKSAACVWARKYLDARLAAWGPQPAVGIPSPKQPLIQIDRRPKRTDGGPGLAYWHAIVCRVGACRDSQNSSTGRSKQVPACKPMRQATSRRNQCPKYPALYSSVRRFCGIHHVKACSWKFWIFGRSRCTWRSLPLLCLVYFSSQTQRKPFLGSSHKCIDHLRFCWADFSSS